MAGLSAAFATPVSWSTVPAPVSGPAWRGQLAGGSGQQQGAHECVAAWAAVATAGALAVARHKRLSRHRERVTCWARGGQIAPVLPQVVDNPRLLTRNRRLSDSLEDILKLIDGEIPDEYFKGVSTGWESLDKLYRPVRGELTVISGVPGSGKSEWLLSMAINLARQHNWRFGLCMFEHKTEDMAQQLLEKLQCDRYTKVDTEAQQRHFDFMNEHLKLIGKFSEELSIDSILQSAQYFADKHKDQGGCQGLIIDPYNYIARTNTANVFETDFVSVLLTKIKQFATKNKCHVWVVVHPTKQSQVNQAAASLYNCSGSAHWNNKADMGIIVERNRRKSDGPTDEVTINVQKVRNKFAGEVGQVKLKFDWISRCYAELSD